MCAWVGTTECQSRWEEKDSHQRLEEIGCANQRRKYGKITMIKDPDEVQSGAQYHFLISGVQLPSWFQVTRLARLLGVRPS